ncbi:endothelial differentiation-related factor [Anaeramoeba flamelloides]|uniref:Endothelial differentiation-related factor n=1 Tax=Anaeramoeba flamelloides TaxID=1746091 RepID=A0AAV7ZXL7_9EUKA|nr:endothelial differentiation-related factor [Anaeramoeba flamelloides]
MNQYEEEDYYEDENYEEEEYYEDYNYDEEEEEEEDYYEEYNNEEEKENGEEETTNYVETTNNYQIKEITTGRISDSRYKWGKGERKNKFEVSEKRKGVGQNKTDYSNHYKQIDQQTQTQKIQKLGKKNGNLILKARNKLRFSQLKVSKLAGIKLNLYKEYEKGSVIPDQRILSKILNVLKIKIVI